MYEKIDKDLNGGVLGTLAQDDSSRGFAEKRVREIIEGSLKTEKEVRVNKLMQEVAFLKSELNLSQTKSVKAEEELKLANSVIRSMEG